MSIIMERGLNTWGGMGRWSSLKGGHNFGGQTIERGVIRERCNANLVNKEIENRGGRRRAKERRVWETGKRAPWGV